ncbi:MAG: tyrosine-type recombinase/integrase [Myxococcales bacterium]|nr:tyrosine-type recombinase/integrase [Myxococcales bacterium]
MFAAVSHLRQLLRFLHGQGLLHRDLVRVVPSVPYWQHSKIPRHLAWGDVRATIDLIDSSTPTGKRDLAMLLLFATTGLRSQEVRRLELGDIDWRAARLHIRRTKTRRERVVPLTAEAGRALADYILRGRPAHAAAAVFLRHVAPAGPLRLSSTVAAIVRRRLRDRGHRPAWAGAHLLRHSLATRLVQQGRSIKEVADLMGHRQIDTTAIYVKVALPQLARVALPFPGVDP